MRGAAEASVAEAKRAQSFIMMKAAAEAQTKSASDCVTGSDKAACRWVYS